MKQLGSALIISLLLVSSSSSQWQPDVRLTNDPAYSYTAYTNAWCIAASGNVVHVVWQDDRDTNFTGEIYYKHSTDGGVSWGADTQLTNNPSSSQSPSVSVSGQVVHVVWNDTRHGNWTIYYKRSTDGGVSWGTDTRLTINPAHSNNPSVTVSASVVHAVWHDRRDVNYQIYYKLSTDGGSSWGADTRLSSGRGDSRFPSVSVSGSVVHVVWFDIRDGNPEIYYKRSADGGGSWGTDTRLTNNAAVSQFPSVSVSGQVVHVVWSDDRNGNWEIYYKRSSDGGISWGADTRLTNNSASSEFPSVTVSGSVLHVVWQDERNGNKEIYYKRSTDGGTSWGADTRLTNNSAVSDNPSVTVSGSVLHVVWNDTRDGNYEIYYKRDPTGNVTGIENTASEFPEAFRLEQNYPNPFNPTTAISYQLTARSFVSLKVYDVLAREVATLVNEEKPPGTYEVTFDASGFSSGVYFYRLSTTHFVQTRKLVLLR